MAEYCECHRIQLIFGTDLNGFQFSYDIPPDEIQVVVQAYASANAAIYDDFIWEKYRWGEALNVMDPETNRPATRNIWDVGTSRSHHTDSRTPAGRAKSPVF